LGGVYPWLVVILFFTPTNLALLCGLSGLLVLTNDPFAGGSPHKYVRLAGFLSLSSFMVNYNPKIFGGILGRVGGKVEHGSLKGDQASGSKNPPTDT
jgi:hypothetical protein